MRSGRWSLAGRTTDGVPRAYGIGMDAEARNAVARAVDIAAGLVDAHDTTSPHWPEHLTAAVDDITAALVAAGVDQAQAAWATTKWLITRQDVWRCVAETDEKGPAAP